MSLLKIRSLSCLVCLTLLASLSGCGAKGDFAVAYVKGTIKKQDGTPIQSGKIKFAPISTDAESKAGKPAFGRIKDGEFELTTYSNSDGAVIGKHTVYLTEARAKDGNERHNCVISPEQNTVEVVAGTNEIELVAVPKPRPKRSAYEEEEDDD